MKIINKNRVCQLFKIQFPIIQGGMVWCSGWKLATAVSNAGGLGLIGAGSMSPELLEKHILKAKEHCTKPFGVNVPLISREPEAKIDLIIKHQVPVAFTSAGNPAIFTSKLKEQHVTVAHVIANRRFARKAQEEGVDAIVAEGFEAGGHNGREETTTGTLIPLIADEVQLPLIAAGGMFNGKSLLAALALGADGIQVGSRFAICKESSAHELFKRRVREISEGDTRLVLKDLAPTRMIVNAFCRQVLKAEASGISRRELNELLGTGRSKKGIFEGDLEEGELEIGQVAALLNKSEGAAEIVQDIMRTFEAAYKKIAQ